MHVCECMFMSVDGRASRRCVAFEMNQVQEGLHLLCPFPLKGGKGQMHTSGQ